MISTEVSEKRATRPINEERIKGGHFMEAVAILDELQRRARQDADLKQRLLDTKNAEDPLAAFCETCRELGYPLYEMDVVVAGEEFYASMSRSINGGGENHPMMDGEDDFYELFFACLEK